MPNYPRIGFSVIVQHGEARLSLCRGFKTREQALAVALRLAEVRPTGVDEMHIRCDASREQWPVRDLTAATPAG